MAHTYATDSGERKIVPFFLAAAAIGGAYLTFHLLKKYHIEMPWWAFLPIDTMGMYGLLYAFFDRVAWKWRFTRWIGVTQIPDLSGTWYGQVQPAPTPGMSAGLAAPIDITLSIKQSWTEILIGATTNQSRSHSLSGAIVVADDPSLSYEYANEPLPSAATTMHAHRGIVRLMVNPSRSVLEGEYYSGRDRQNIGTIRVARS